MAAATSSPALSAPRSTTATSRPAPSSCPFAGWEMPVQYAGVRRSTGRARAARRLRRLPHGRDRDVRARRPPSSSSACSPTTSPSSRVGGAQYSVLCREDGGVLDDLFTYRLGADRCLTVTNASNHDKDLAWFLQPRRRLRRRGRATRTTATRCSPSRARGRARSSRRSATARCPCASRSPTRTAARRARVLVCGTGYTGEDGVELLLDAGRRAAPSGTSCAPRRRARRARRARHAAPGGLLPPLRQRPDARTRGPIEAGLGWCCKEDTGFIGSDAVRAARDRRARPRSSSPSLHRRRASPARATRSSAAARSTSGTHVADARRRASAWPTCRAALAEPGTELQIDVRGKRRAAVGREASPLLPAKEDPWLTRAIPTTCCTTPSTTGPGSTATIATFGDHLVRPGRARRGRLLRPARGRARRSRRTSPTPRSSRSRRSRTSSRRCRRDRRGQHRAGRHPRGDQRRPLRRRAGWSRSGCPTQPRQDSLMDADAYQASSPDLDREGPLDAATPPPPTPTCGDARRDRRRARSRSSSTDRSPRACASTGALDLPAGRCPSRRSTRTCASWPPATRRAEDEITFLGAGMYDHYVPAVIDMLMGALGVPDALHALPARDLPGRAAGDVRVPDGDQRADGAAGVQRLGLRGPERRRGRRLPGASSPTARARSSSRAACTRTPRRRWRPRRTATALEVVEVELRDGVTDPEAWAEAIDGETGAVDLPAAELPRRGRGRRGAGRRGQGLAGRRRRRLRPDPAGHPQAARRVRRRRRRRRGPDARQPPGLRRPVVRVLRRHAGLPAPHAGPHRGRDRPTSTGAAASC